MLLDEKNRGVALRPLRLERGHQFFDHRRLQPLGDFVDQHETRFAHERARDQQHLLLAA